MNNEFISWDDLEQSYHEFLRHKRSTTSAYEYMQLASRDLPKLKQELEDGTYTISDSIAFCVTRPKLREVFAASPRDRVVHHLLIYKFYDMFESVSVDVSFNCRKYKGNSAMTNYVHHALLRAGKNGWVCKTDIQGCFMSIDKDILWSMLESKITDWCCSHSSMKPYTHKWLWLWKMVVYHRPEQKCIIHGDPNLFAKLPSNKTLFKSNGKGLAIGNLTSQILANFYFHNVDRIVHNYMTANEGNYARYMDDVFICAKDKHTVLQGLYLFKQSIKEINLHLHPNKFYLQHAHRSISIIGQTHINGRIYVGNRTVYNAYRAINRFNHLSRTNGYSWTKDNIMHISSSINSYFGFMTKGNTYHIRYSLWLAISSSIKHFLYSNRMRTISVIRKYNPRHRFRRISVGLRCHRSRSVRFGIPYQSHHNHHSHANTRHNPKTTN